jgi:hypothetical protein
LENCLDGKIDSIEKKIKLKKSALKTCMHLKIVVIEKLLTLKKSLT